MIRYFRFAFVNASTPKRRITDFTDEVPSLGSPHRDETDVKS